MKENYQKLGNSLVQHDPLNDRLCLRELHRADRTELATRLEDLAAQHGYSKICVRVPASEAGSFVTAGYQMEAAIPRFYPQGSAACFLAKFRDERRDELRPLVLREVLGSAQMQPRVAAPPLGGEFGVRSARLKDVTRMAALYREVVAAGRLPVHDPEYLRRALKGGAVFACIWRGDLPVALTGALVDRASDSAEFCHCATLAQFRDRGFTHCLIEYLEESLRSRGVISLLASVDAYAYDLNITLARCGYGYSGTLTNDCYDQGRLQSLNLWHKSLPDDPRFAWSFLSDSPERAGLGAVGGGWRR